MTDRTTSWAREDLGDGLPSRYGQWGSAMSERIIGAASEQITAEPGAGEVRL
ncbi:hypothetical protein [Nocardia sp. NPDC052566]|uniref:hypothetical protein n=1 Tax=Nocardia sp. NPDC052566 TaxID=3364330 RepID=UPI0037C569EB